MRATAVRVRARSFELEHHASESEVAAFETGANPFEYGGSLSELEVQAFEDGVRAFESQVWMFEWKPARSSRRVGRSSRGSAVRVAGRPFESQGWMFELVMTGKKLPIRKMLFGERCTKRAVGPNLRRQV